MKAIQRSPAWLVRKSYGYCFNLQVPQDIQKAVGLRAIRFSLQTNNLKKARRLSAQLGAFTWNVFDAIRRDIKQRGCSGMSCIEIKALIKNYLDELLHCDEQIRMTAGDAFKPFYQHLINDIGANAERAVAGGQREREDGVDEVFWGSWQPIADALLERSGCEAVGDASLNGVYLTQELSSAQSSFAAIAKAKGQGKAADAAGMYRDYIEALSLTPKAGLGFEVVDSSKQAETARRSLEHVDQVEATQRLLAQTVSEVSREDAKTSLVADLGEYLFNRLFDARPFTGVPVNKIKKTKESEGIALSTAIEKYYRDSEREREWAETTRKEVSTALNLFQEIVGAKTLLTDLTEDTFRDYRETLQHHYPKDRNKNKKYRDRSKEEIFIMEIPSGDLISPSRLKSCYFQWLCNFLDWAKKQRLIKEDFADMLEIKVSKRWETRKHFERSELEALFCSLKYEEKDGCAHKHSYQFWMPVLALFTGARQAEIAQLEVDDIIQEEGVWCFSFNRRTATEGRTAKTIKNAASIRVVPIHDFLLGDLNFLGYVDKLRTDGSISLFSDLPRGEKAAPRVSKWFLETYRGECGIMSNKEDPDTDLTFHSFRHTFVDTARQLGIGEEYHMEVTGHSDSSKAVHRGYGGKSSASTLKREVMDKLDFGIDLSHLKHSKWVVKA